MDNTVTYKCLGCGAGLLFDADKQRFACEFCLSEFTEQELLESGSAEEEKDYSSEVNEYHCPSCGADVIADKNTAAEICYYCHNPVVLSGKFSGDFKPAKIIPFGLSKEKAKSEFLMYAKKKKFVPRDYFSGEHIEKISGVYYPFWVMDADTDSEMRALGTKVRSWRHGDYRYTETTRFNVYRRGRIHFEDITSSAISTEDRAMLEGILPYPPEEYRDFQMPYLQGFVAKKRDMDKKIFYPEVKARMNNYACELFRHTAQGYTSLNTTSSDVSILNSHWLYSLMPVWVLTYKKRHRNKNKEKTYMYAMNGTTGKVYGEFPVSIPKLLLLFGGIFTGALMLLLLIGYIFFL